MPVLNFATALATCTAALAACFAVWVAWKQMEIMRPAPLLVAKGTWNLTLDAEESDGFVIQNVGSSPAFDIDISEIEGPVLSSVKYSERLITERIFVIGQDCHATAAQHRCTPGNQFRRDVFRFLKNAGQSFAPVDESGKPLRHTLKFNLAYSTLAGKRITTPCAIRFDLGLDTLASIIPDASWLGLQRTPGKQF